ncbi:MAG: hypothetical protein ABI599_03800, partial [Flavobacteriales bacterium]
MSKVLEPLLVLTPRPWKWLRVLLVCAFFTAGGAWILQRENDGFDRVMAWGCVVLFGLGTLLAVLQLLPTKN